MSTAHVKDEVEELLAKQRAAATKTRDRRRALRDKLTQDVAQQNSDAQDAALMARLIDQHHQDQQAPTIEELSQLDDIVAPQPEPEPPAAAGEDGNQPPLPEPAPPVLPVVPPTRLQAFVEIVANSGRTVTVSAQRSTAAEPVNIRIDVGDGTPPYQYHSVGEACVTHTYANSDQNHFTITVTVRDGSGQADEATLNVTVLAAVVVTQVMPAQFSPNPRTWGRSFWIWLLAAIGVLIGTLAVGLPTYEVLFSHHHVPWEWARDLLRVLWFIALAAAGFFIGARLGWEIDHRNDPPAGTEAAPAAA